MEPRMTAREPFAVLGVVTQVRRGSETPGLFAGIWKEFESYREQIQSRAAERQALETQRREHDEQRTGRT